MEQLSFWVQIAAAVYLGFMATVLDTKGLSSGFVFRFIPLVLCVLIALDVIR